MKLIKYGVGLLFFAAVLMVVVMPAAAWETTEIMESGDGYMINNVVIDFGSIGINEELDKSTVSIYAYEWKNDSWQSIKNSSKLTTNGTFNFTASDGNYSVYIDQFRDSSKFGSVRVEIWTNANVTNSAYVTGGHNSSEGTGKPNLVITKVISPAEGIAVDDLFTVTVYVNNSGNYDAKNVTITDPYQPGFLMSNVTINNTQGQTINKNTNNTYLVYQLKAVEPGNYTLQKATATAENNVGMKFNYTQNNDLKIEVGDLAALTFTPAGPDGNTVDYYTRSKIDGNITVRNIGTMPAQYVSIEFALPDNATISGKDITVSGNKATLYIDQITPNNQRVVEYSLSATSGGFYEVPITYSYTYNNSSKTGEVQTVSYNAVGSNTIGKLLDYWYLIFIPIILIAVAALFLWKRHREYKF